MKVFVQGSNTAVDLTQRNFVAQGGQAQIFAKGGTTYKVYHDPANALPIGKIHALSVLTDPRIIRPQQVLVNDKGVPVGYTTTFVKDAYALCQLFPKSFREREGVTHDITQALVRKLQEGVTHVHSKGVLIVDLNEMNFLVDHGFGEVYFIDTDSYQVPGYPCPVLMESVRDWSVTGHQWSPLSDWFSFAVVSFQMFTGVHPYKGQYKGSEVGFRTKLPGDADDDAFAVTRRRMKSHVSVFHHEVGVPAAVYPFDVIPAAYRAWYKAVFADGKRCAPPDSFGATVLVMPTVKATLGTGALDIMEIGTYDGTINRIFSDGTHLVVVSDKGVWLDQSRVPVPHAVHGCAFSPKASRAVLADGSTQPVPTLTNLTDRTPVPFSLAASEVSSHDKRLYMRAGEQVHEVVLTDVGTQVIASTRPVVNILPHATRLFPGVVVQNLLGSVFVSLLSGPGIARQVRIKELDGYKVLDARFDSGVLMVVGGSKKGTYDRLVFRFDDADTYDLRIVKDITVTGLNFVVLDSGVCVSLTEEDKLEVFPAKRGSSSMKVVEDKVLGADMILAKHAGSVLFARGNKVYRMKLK